MSEGSIARPTGSPKNGRPTRRHFKTENLHLSSRGRNINSQKDGVGVEKVTPLMLILGIHIEFPHLYKLDHLRDIGVSG